MNQSRVSLKLKDKKEKKERVKESNRSDILAQDLIKSKQVSALFFVPPCGSTASFFSGYFSLTPPQKKRKKKGEICKIKEIP